MNPVCRFLNTRIENSGALAWMGDMALTPVRYLFNGSTLRIDMQKLEVHRIASFHAEGSSNRSYSDPWLESQPTGMIQTALAVALLVPGLLVGVILKGLSYLSADIKNLLVRDHFTPITRTLGSDENPIRTREQLRDAVQAEYEQDPIHHLTEALIIHGDGALTINEESGIINRFNPMKLILKGARIVHESCAYTRLDDLIFSSSKWKVESDFLTTPDATGYSQSQRVASIAEALEVKAPIRDCFTRKCYHLLFTVSQ
jgi:hypothetical protein